jgi:Ca-activated chloride channel family protein
VNRRLIPLQCLLTAFLWCSFLTPWCLLTLAKVHKVWGYRCGRCPLQIHGRTTTVAAGLRIHQFGCISVMYVASTSSKGVTTVSKANGLSSRVVPVFATLLGLISGFSPVCTAAQSLIDEVHINPPSESRVSARAGQMELALNTSTPPIKVDVDLVLVPVTITDSQERLILGLREKNFEVFEGKSRQEIRHFSSEDSPVSLGVIFDMSGSMNTKIDRAREAVIEFLKAANPQDEFFLIAFSDLPEEISDFTTSVEDVQSRLLHTFPKGRTALIDAIYMGITKMRQARYSRKALLIISDGGDNHSRYTEGEIKSLVKESDVMLYGVGIYDRNFSTPEERLGPWLLTDITEITGGRAFTIDNPNSLPAVARAIGVQLRNQYVIGYRPTQTKRNGKWHKIKVKLTALKGLPPLHVRAKTGYYAPAD